MPKSAVREIIPEAFADFMQEVRSQIEQGDEATTIESDDLLQRRDCYGGLVDPEREIFAFTFFLNTDCQWELFLTKSQILDIASGKLKVLIMWKCADEKCPHRFSEPEAYCSRCDRDSASDYC